MHVEFTEFRLLREGWEFVYYARRWSLRLSVRIPGFQPGERGSIPLGTTIHSPEQPEDGEPVRFLDEGVPNNGHQIDRYGGGEP